MFTRPFSLYTSRALAALALILCLGLAACSASTGRIAFEEEKNYQEKSKKAPDNVCNWESWGDFLTSRAENTKDPADKDLLLESAIEKYRTAAEIAPENSSVQYSWGRALWLRAAVAPQPEMRLSLRRQGGEKMGAAAQRSSNSCYMSGWGFALYHLGREEQSPAEKAMLFAQAEDAFRKVLSRTPKDIYAIKMLANTLIMHSKIAEGNAAKAAMLRKAEVQIASGLKIAPDDITLLESSFLETTYRYHVTSSPKEKRRLLDKSDAALRKAMTLGYESYYNRACIAALRGNAEECRTLLMQEKGAGSLPSRDIINKDKDLDSVRNLPWFAEILAAAK